jgi:Ca2+-binding EF-hand superfamily protein
MCRVCGLTLLTLALALVSGAGAQTGDKAQPKKKLPPEVAELLKLGPDEFIKRFDKNKNGLLSPDELPPYLADAFKRYDANGDGQLNRAEVQLMLQELRGSFGAQGSGPDKAQVEAFVDKLLAQLDTNKDGKISKAEAKGPLALNFDQVDQNKDGFLDRNELRVVAARILANPKGPGFKGKGGPFKGFGPGLDFDAYDRNADGRLTRDEVRGTPLEKLFDQIDTNRDGRISREEFEAYLEKSVLKKK